MQGVIVKMLRELVGLYPETRHPQAARNPVRLPPSVSPLHGTVRERARQSG